MNSVMRIAAAATVIAMSIGSGLSFAGSSFDAHAQKKAGKSLADCKKEAQKESVTFPGNATVKDHWRQEWQKQCDAAYK